MSPTAIPPRGKPLPKGARTLWPFTYSQEPDVIRATLAQDARALQGERGVLHWALKNGRREMALKLRAWIDYAETAQRNGRARLRQLEAAHAAH